MKIGDRTLSMAHFVGNYSEYKLESLQSPEVFELYFQEQYPFSDFREFVAHVLKKEPRKILIIEKRGYKGC